MEETFLNALEAAVLEARRIGVRLRPVDRTKALENARRCLSGSRDSEGFGQLLGKNRLDLTVEALAVQKAYTALFTDEQVNNALMRLLDAGYKF